jgi:hypothetical protein
MKEKSWIERLHEELGDKRLDKPPNNSFSLEDYAREMNFSISYSYRRISEMLKDQKISRHFVRDGGRTLTYFTFNEKTKAR